MSRDHRNTFIYFYFKQSTHSIQFIIFFRLHTGWSSLKPAGPLDADEKNAIIEVIKRNELLESAERQRVGKLVERVEKIKQRAAECGPRFCRYA